MVNYGIITIKWLTSWYNQSLFEYYKDYQLVNHHLNRIISLIVIKPLKLISKQIDWSSFSTMIFIINHHQTSLTITINYQPVLTHQSTIIFTINRHLPSPSSNRHLPFALAHRFATSVLSPDQAMVEFSKLIRHLPGLTRRFWYPPGN